MQVSEEIGRTFATALRSFLRHDPDVILVGEMRDQETAQIAVRAALTGHLVLSTLHTNSAAQTISRLQDMGVPPFLVASSLRVVVAQRLARKVCQGCRQPYPLDEARANLLIQQIVGLETERLRLQLQNQLDLRRILTREQFIRFSQLAQTSRRPAPPRDLRPGGRDVPPVRVGLAG